MIYINAFLFCGLICLLGEIILDNTNLTNLDFLKNMPKLKRVSIDERQHEKNLELFKNLEKNHILVLNENIVWFTE